MTCIAPSECFEVPAMSPTHGLDIRISLAAVGEEKRVRRVSCSGCNFTWFGRFKVPSSLVPVPVDGGKAEELLSKVGENWNDLHRNCTAVDFCRRRPPMTT